MSNCNKVFIATSLDGYIADSEGKIDWLHSIPNPDGNDMGYNAFISTIDAIVMGKNTFNVVCSFGIEWPYTKPVFVLSNSLLSIPKEYSNKATLVKGNIEDVLNQINNRGYKKLYIDGGTVIQSCLKANLIDEIIITTIPILLGGGTHLFSSLPQKQEWELVQSTVFLKSIVQSHYKRKRLS